MQSCTIIRFSPDNFSSVYHQHFVLYLTNSRQRCKPPYTRIDLWGSWILKNAEKIPHENRVGSYPLFPELCSAIFHRFRIQISIQFNSGFGIQDSIQIPFWTSIELDIQLILDIQSLYSSHPPKVHAAKLYESRMTQIISIFTY